MVGAYFCGCIFAYTWWDYNQHAGGDSLCVILCVCVNFACCLVAFQNLADVKQSLFQLMMA